MVGHQEPKQTICVVRVEESAVAKAEIGPFHLVGDNLKVVEVKVDGDAEIESGGEKQEWKAPEEELAYNLIIS